MSKSKQTKERAIPFDDRLFERVSESAVDDRRHFKHQAAALIEEALDARDHDAALAE